MGRHKVFNPRPRAMQHRHGWVWRVGPRLIDATRRVRAMGGVRERGVETASELTACGGMPLTEAPRLFMMLMA